MRSRFRRLNTPTKLLIVTFLFLFPLAAALFFMDMGFAYDVNIARTELSANAYARYVLPLVTGISRLVSGQTKNSGGDEGFPAELSRLETALESLLRRIDRLAPSRRYIPSTKSDKRLLLASLNHMKAELAHLAERPENLDALSAISEDIKTVVSYIGDCGMLALDPAPDSNHLAALLYEGFPLFFSGMNSFCLFTRREAPRSPKPGQTERIAVYLSRVLDLTEVYIIRNARASLAADPSYYGRSAFFQNEYPVLLRRFNASLSRYAEVVRAYIKAGAPAGDRRRFCAAWKALYIDGLSLFETGIAALDELIRRRIRSYQRWRFIGFAGTAAASAFAGILLFSVSRGITRPIRFILEYVDSVSRGRYESTLSKHSFTGEFARLAGDIESMVGELKYGLAFSRGLLDSIGAPFLVANADSRLIFLNRAILQFTGRNGDPEDYSGMSIYEFFRRDKGITNLTNACMVDRVCVENEELRMTGPDGKKLSAAVYISPIYDLDNQMIGLCLFLYDMTALRSREAEILQQHSEIERLASFPRENPSPVLAADADGEIFYMNPATETILSRHRISLSDFLPTDHKSIITACLRTNRSRAPFSHGVKDRVYSWAYSPLISDESVQIHVRDITEQTRMEEQLVHNAFHDTLTGLPNRALYTDRLKQALRHMRDVGGGFFAVLHLDVDQFQYINNSLGHAVGDDFLREIAVRIRPVLPTGDTLARFGGDEFAVLLLSAEDAAGAIQTTRTIMEAVGRPYRVGRYEIRPSISIGIVAETGKYVEPTEILRDADTALNRAKAMGRNRYEVFNEKMHESVKSRLSLENDLKRAVEAREFTVFYQPIVHLADGAVAGFEALIRWRHPEKGLVSPGVFIPLAEETGLIVPLEIFVLNNAARQAEVWRRRFGLDSLMMSVNLSVRHVNDTGLVDDIRNALAESGLPPECLKLEITESGIMKNPSKALERLTALQKMGVMLSIDDFGTGHSSLNYLNRFPFDFLKIDRSFIDGMERDDTSFNIVKTIISLALDMNKRVIAEGIEVEAQKRHLFALGCHFGQGFFFAEPLPPAEAEGIMTRGPDWRKEG